jgi:urease accessory protein
MCEPLRATSFRRAGDYSGLPFDLVVLDHAERHLRRRVLTAVHDDRILVDLPEATRLHSGDVLVLDDGRLLEVIAAEEYLLDIRAYDAELLARLAWHIGNRHIPAQIEETRILIQRDHVIAGMLRQLGAYVVEISEPFEPEGGAYAHGHNDAHDHHDDEAHE